MSLDTQVEVPSYVTAIPTREAIQKYDTFLPASASEAEEQARRAERRTIDLEAQRRFKKTLEFVNALEFLVEYDRSKDEPSISRETLSPRGDIRGSKKYKHELQRQIDQDFLGPQQIERIPLGIHMKIFK